MTRNPIIIALDVKTAADAHAIVRALGPRADFYKVGLELYAAAGMQIVRELQAEGKKVFLDLKLHDIGETVRRAAARVAETGVQFLTVHATRQVMEAAVKGSAGSDLEILAVTVLTSLSDDDLIADGYAFTAAELTARRVSAARELGVHGVVCSPLETARVRSLAGSGMRVVVPGVRSAGADPGDQKRVATPAQAIKDGADYLVVGRQVTRAAEPAAALHALLAEIAYTSY